MANVLPRLKPQPIPAIHPVPEYAATGPLKDVYARTMAGLGVPWMGVVAMAFAHYPTFYDTLWSALEPIVGCAHFAEACDILRAEAEAQAAILGAERLEGGLRDIGYDARECDEIRDCIEVFAAGNMPYILMATIARGLLEGHAWNADGDPGPSLSRQPMPKPALMEPHHATPQTQAIFEDVKATLGLPFVNTDYRALARWPSYFELAWGDLSVRTKSGRYATCVQTVHETATTLCGALPNPNGLTSEVLLAAASKDAEFDDVRDVVRLFQWLLPGLAVNVSILKAQLVR